jgi:NADPH-dependent ferric siderophore reductase
MRSTHAAVLRARQALTSRTVRLTLEGPSLIGLQSFPAQDIEVLLTDSGTHTLKRRYTIRRARPASGEIDIDVVFHEPGGPGSRWAEETEIGSAVEFIGPCGKLELRRADWHLFVGDESSLPAISALCEAIPRDQTTIAVVQVASHTDRMSVTCSELEWVTRGAAPADSVDLLRSEVSRFLLPNPNGRAYLLGEHQVVLALREALESRGLARDRIFAKSYWRAQPSVLQAHCA